MKLMMTAILPVAVSLWTGGCGGQGADRCDGVVCNQAPRASCKDENTLIVYAKQGTCKPNDGKCEYAKTERSCDLGCQAGRCLTGEEVCIDDGDALGPPCMEVVETQEDFERLAVDSHKHSATKFMLPARDDPELLPVVFQNSNRFALHIEFLRATFPDRFGDLNPSGYLEMIMKRDSRSYFTGVVQRLDDVDQGHIYGFNTWTDLQDPSEQLEMSEVAGIYRLMRDVFLPEKLVYLPTDAPAITKARTWIEPDFPIYLGWDEVLTEVYTSGTAYGRVRLFSLEELDAAISRGEIGWQDIVVVERVPFDIETVVAGVVTGGRQWELSHVNVRMARRATPNLFIRDALSKIEQFEGQLIRLDATRAATSGSDDRYTITEATLSDAEAWWAGHRPDIGSAPAIDADHRELTHLLEMDLDDDPQPLISRFGGKTSNLAKLYALVSPDYQVAAFGVPFAFFEDFMQANSIEDTRVDPPEEVSLREYVLRLIADERFRTDAAYRRDRLWDLRAAMRDESGVDPALVARLAARIQEVFGSTSVRVRFRSSSNVEDALEFSGAGLYSSTSVCAADSLDDDLSGPSICDLDQDEERSIERGLIRVWASLFNSRAWEERDWYQIPHEDASMAILVSLAFPDERSNGVAFTGNPGNSNDDRYLINAQLGDESVVGNDPRVVPEMDLLTLDADSGEVSKIYRSRSSALASPGNYVLTDEQLAVLGARLFEINRDYPLDTGTYTRDKVLLDLEFKVDSQGQIKIKQIRPFLDKCRHIVCNQPPDDMCQDTDTLIEHRSFGTCDGGRGECRYDTSEKHCENGCLDGACLE